MVENSKKVTSETSPLASLPMDLDSPYHEVSEKIRLFPASPQTPPPVWEGLEFKLVVAKIVQQIISIIKKMLHPESSPLTPGEGKILHHPQLIS